jgi:hypothetical protein
MNEKEILLEEGEKRLFQSDGEFTIEIRDGYGIIVPLTPCFIDHGITK